MKKLFNIKGGVTRIVWVFRDIVIKFPNFKRGYMYGLHGLLGNLQEAGLSSSHESLAKVLFCQRHGLFLVMERVTLVEEVLWGKSDDAYDFFELEEEFIEKLEEQFEDDPMKEVLLSDAKTVNWGYTKDNRLVKIDYADCIEY